MIERSVHTEKECGQNMQSQTKKTNDGSVHSTTSQLDDVAQKIQSKISGTAKTASIELADPFHRQQHDQEVVGLGEGARRATIKAPNQLTESKKIRCERFGSDIPLKDDEEYARSKVERRPLVLTLIGYYTALKIFFLYLISLSSIIAAGLSVGLTMYWYDRFRSGEEDELSASGMDWVLLGFAVVTPLSLLIGIAFRRRDRALMDIARFRSFSFQLFLSHCIWDWAKDGGKAGTDIDWAKHADDVLKEMIAIGDELYRFLTLPSASMGRHRMTRGGRREAARTAEVAYRLYDSLSTKRFVRLSKLSERVKLAGLGASEASRMRQYERWMGDAIENLRMIKSYRTPQTLRSFARLFTTFLPPFFAPVYAQLALNIGSLAIGLTVAIITALCLNALLEGVEILEDPFVGFVTLDGIDIREEFQVLHWQQLVSARNEIFPEAMPYEDAEALAAGKVVGNVKSPKTTLKKSETHSISSSEILRQKIGSMSAMEYNETNDDEVLDDFDESPPAPKKSMRPGLFRHGDASFLRHLDKDTKVSRKSAYQLSK